MSGGHFDYIDSQLKDEIFGWTNAPSNKLEDMEISELVWDVLNLLHVFDYYKCGDSGRDDYIKAKNEFKQKWFAQDRTEMLKDIIDREVDELKRELYSTCLGIDIDERKE